MRKKTPKLTFKDAISIWRMRWAGAFQHDIAAYFGVNQGRISEVLNGKRWKGSEGAARAVT